VGGSVERQMNGKHLGPAKLGANLRFALAAGDEIHG